MIEGDMERYMEQVGLSDVMKFKRAEYNFLEDYFPPLELGEEERKELSVLFDRNLKICMDYVNSYVDLWATYRAVFMMEYIRKYIPDVGFNLPVFSGLLYEHTKKALEKLKRSFILAQPLFIPDYFIVEREEDLDFLRRASNCLHLVLRDQLNIYDVFLSGVLFDFLVDGSAIVEVDTTYESVTRKILRTYFDLDSLIRDRDKVVSEKAFELAREQLSLGRMARVLVEEEVVKYDGLQLFYVDKVDHLIPPKVYNDNEIRFRARRLYLTSSDLQVLSELPSGEGTWYDKEAVQKVLDARFVRKGMLGMSASEEKMTMLKEVVGESADILGFPLNEDKELIKSNIYDDTFSIYRIFCEYRYPTRKDPQGKIGKFCIFDYSPEGKQILRAVMYPHFTDERTWIHFKLGHAPKQYYGYGFGRALVHEDFLLSNVTTSYFQSAVLSAFRPLAVRYSDTQSVSPVLMPGGYGPAKLIYAENPTTDIQVVDSGAPPEGIVRVMLPFLYTIAENRTAVTSLVQGKVESSDPRAPAQKAMLLLSQAETSFDDYILDFSLSGLEKLGNLVWKLMYEISEFAFSHNFSAMPFRGFVVRTREEVGDSVYKVSLDELRRNIIWRSALSAYKVNPEYRARRFMNQFMFFMPLLQTLGKLDNKLFLEYFLRWIRRAAYELELDAPYELLPILKNIKSDEGNIDVNELRSNLSELFKLFTGSRLPEEIVTQGLTKKTEEEVKENELGV